MKLESDGPLSKIAFHFNLRRYILVPLFWMYFLHPRQAFRKGNAEEATWMFLSHVIRTAVITYASGYSWPVAGPHGCMLISIYAHIVPVHMTKCVKVLRAKQSKANHGPITGSDHSAVSRNTRSERPCPMAYAWFTVGNWFAYMYLFAHFSLSHTHLAGAYTRSLFSST